MSRSEFLSAGSSGNRVVLLSKRTFTARPCRKLQISRNAAAVEQVGLMLFQIPLVRADTLAFCGARVLPERTGGKSGEKGKLEVKFEGFGGWAAFHCVAEL